MFTRKFLGALALAAAALATPAAAHAQKTFMSSAKVNVAASTATFPLQRGVTTDGRTVWYVILDTSSGDQAKSLGVNRANKLENARNSAAVTKVTRRNGMLVFPATVDFAPERVVVPGPGGFPPTAFQPGAVGEPGYSPLIQLPEGTIVNAPHIANTSGRSDKVVTMDTIGGKVVLDLTIGFANGKKVLYLSTDASDPLAATLENATLAPQLAFAPGRGDDSTNSSRAALGATINGQLGAANPNQQGFNSALLNGISPRNALAWTPNQGRYSPLWDVHIGAWTTAAVTGRRNVALSDFDDFEDAADEGDLTGPDGGAFGATGIVVNCPIVFELE